MSISDIIFSQDLIHSIGWTLLHSLWQGGLIGLITLLVLNLMKHSPAAHRYAVSCMALMLIPLMAIITYIILDGQAVPRDVAGSSPGGTTAGIQLILLDPTLTRDLNGAAWKEDLSRSINLAMPWMVAFWFAGLIVLMVRQLGGIYYIRRISNKYSRPIPGRIQRIADQIALRMNRQRKVPVMESLKVQIPVAIGYLRPLIILPLGMAGSIPSAQIESILIHEMAHIYRKDYLVNILQSIIESLFFFNPAIWWLSRNIRQERENCCDDITVKYIADPIIYIKALTHMEDRTSFKQTLVPALAGSRKSLLERVRRLAGVPVYRHRLSGFMIPALVLISGIVIILINTAFTVDKDTAASFSRVFYEDALVSQDLIAGNSGNPGEELPAAVPADGHQKVTLWPLPDTTRSPEQARQEKLAREEALGNTQEARQRLEEARQALQEAREEYLKAFHQQQKLRHDAMEDFSREVYRNVIVIKDGDSIMIRHDSTFFPPEPWDSTFDMEFFHEFEGIDEEAMQREMQKARREAERVHQEMESGQKEMGRMNHDMQIRQERMQRQARRDMPGQFHWQLDRPDKTERIIRQELEEDGLVSGHKSYIVEINGNGLFINGEKQPRDIFKKYKKLYEGLEGDELNSGSSFRLVF